MYDTDISWWSYIQGINDNAHKMIPHYAYVEPEGHYEYIPHGAPACHSHPFPAGFAQKIVMFMNLQAPAGGNHFKVRPLMLEI